MNILILTGKFNMGHYSAAQSLLQELTAAYPDAAVTVQDFLTFAIPRMDSAVYKIFQVAVTRAHRLYNVHYRMTESGTGDVLPAYAWPLLGAMEELLALEEPDVVISTHPLCTQLVGRCKKRGSFDGVLITCVTDVTGHGEWICQGCDGYMVAAETVRDALVQRGIDPRHITVTGIPVRRQFKESCRQEREEDGLRQLLIMGGGPGLLPKDDDFYEGVNDLPGVQTTLITGSNQKLFERLVGRYPNILVLGYTQDVYAYMLRSDLVLSKPGGSTTFEAIFSATPMLAWEPRWEQERRNAAFLEQEGVGRVAARNTESCLTALRELLGDPTALATMGENMRSLRSRFEDRGLEKLMERLMEERVRV